MAAKPDVTLARWATDNTNNTPPAGGQRDTGWTPGQTGVSDYDNEIKRQLYFWALYLNDGDLVGDHTIDGTLYVEDALTVDSSITITGTIHRPSRFWMLSALGFVPSIDPGNLQGITDNSNGYLMPDEPTPTTRRAYCGLPVRADEQIFAAVLRIREGAQTVSMKMYKIEYTTGTRTQIGTTQTSGTGSSDTFLILMPSEDVDDDHFYWVEVSCAATSSAAQIYGLILQMTVP